MSAQHAIVSRARRAPRSRADKQEARARRRARTPPPEPPRGRSNQCILTACRRRTRQADPLRNRAVTSSPKAAERFSTFSFAPAPPCASCTTKHVPRLAPLFCGPASSPNNLRPTPARGIWKRCRARRLRSPSPRRGHVDVGRRRRVEPDHPQALPLEAGNYSGGRVPDAAAALINMLTVGARRSIP